LLWSCVVRGKALSPESQRYAVQALLAAFT
jgi:hypothetical protein